MGPQTVVVPDEPIGVRDEAERLDAQFSGNPYMIPWEETQRHFEAFPRISIAQMAHDAAPDATRVNVPMNAISGWAGQADGFWDQLKRWDLDGYAVQLLCTNSGERRRLLELLTEQGYQPGEGNFDLRVELGRLRAGFTSPADRFAILSEREIFGRKYVSRKRRRFEAGAAVTAFSDLRAADYVVHQEHGIGRYLGLKRFPGKASDFLAIQYHGNDVIYVPVTHVDQIQKYIGGGGAIPKMDKLGGGTWVRTKSKVKKSVQDMAEELIKLYAARERSEGHAFPPDTHWQDEFEDSFEYDETPDQLTAIAAIKQDMEMAKPMDRLLCGDVGYGKTEVALRAAFKAVMERKQVAMLVPTTVLAEQHYLTFCDRLADYPVRVEMLSRFRTAKENRETIQRMRAGEVDIVIGTHRLTSGDVQFKDLGLVILDEEQRFGVKHKEKLKKLKVNVDVLTMTATPIPRTLHLSMSGIRDMSMITTAPNDRLPIHTCIEAFDEALIAEAIERELGREGQVFYLHNRVQTIDRVAAMIRKLVPRARVAIGHGQMHEHELEETMARFIRGETDVLVCTTIIGSGLDIPNANTIIVDRADQFGLAELYQLRGRVGRYKHRAFAYLLVPGDKALSQDAQRRLKALEEFSTLGSGFRIAMRDLEIRGAGNILGAEQSGHIQIVGYQMYCELLAAAVRKLKGQQDETPPATNIDLGFTTYIPKAYIAGDRHRMEVYRKIAVAKTSEDLGQLETELTDVYGRLPEEVELLLELVGLRIAAGKYGIKTIVTAGQNIVFSFAEDAKKSANSLFANVAGKVNIIDAKTIYLHLPKNYFEPATMLNVLRKLFRTAE
ncbi:MAG: transcription-repair coupling factor [Candidatus Hydrogenedentes bacterium]|nr:transcription-repair coupling factor [Candidatus Hydrogenedentota bacterium]